MKGVDYASIDGNRRDFQAAKRAGITFAIARAAYCYKGVSYPDGSVQDRDLAKLAGVTFGAYMILDWHVDPAVQVATFVRSYGARRPGELPPWLDLEADSAAAVGKTPAECLAWAEAAYAALAKVYGCVGVYTSSRVWSEVFGNLDSRDLGVAPLWLKVPYLYAARQPAHFDDNLLKGEGEVPTPWQASDSAPVAIVQYQGDALSVPGFTSTVDLNLFSCKPSAWLTWHLGGKSITEFQVAKGLVADGIVGPATFAALTA